MWSDFESIELFFKEESVWVEKIFGIEFEVHEVFVLKKKY